MIDLKVKDIRHLISRIDPISMCDKEKLSYQNFFNINEVPEIYDKYYVHGIGIIDSEFSNGEDMLFKKHIEIVYYDKPLSYTSRFQSLYKTGNIFYCPNDDNYYQLVNIYDDEVEFIKLKSTSYKISENKNKTIPKDIIDPDDFGKTYFYFGSTFEHTTHHITNYSTRTSLLCDDMNFILYSGLIFNKLRIENEVLIK